MNATRPVQEDTFIALVDEQDHILGYEEKLLVHRQGLLHRAFSIFVLNERGEILLQRRAWQKYHSPGLWTNTCCSHGIEGEPLAVTAARRLQEEMGFTCPLDWQFAFQYQTAFPDGLIEHELDHVYLGHYAGDPNPDPAEVAEWRWTSPFTISRDLRNNSNAYTCWFRLAFERLYPHTP